MMRVFTTYTTTTVVIEDSKTNFNVEKFNPSTSSTSGIYQDHTQFGKLQLYNNLLLLLDRTPQIVYFSPIFSSAESTTFFLVAKLCDVPPAPKLC